MLRRSPKDVEKMLGKDDLHLCEGLLTIFLKGAGPQTVIFDWREDKSRSGNSGGGKEGGGPITHQVLDLGSCKETISLLESAEFASKKMHSRPGSSVAQITSRAHSLIPGHDSAQLNKQKRPSEEPQQTNSST